MPNFASVYDFLERLQQHNTKSWMDANREEYYCIRDFFIGWLEELNEELAQLDPDYFYTPGKKAINRINNNLMFHPNKPVYKDHFGAGLDQVSKQGDFYIEIGLNENLAGGGYWHPSSKTLRSIREAIDYDGDELRAILENPEFKATFGGMTPDKPLKTAPRGYSEEHQHIDLLRRRSFAAACTFSREAVLSEDFKKRIIETYLALLPFRRYLNLAVSV